jgi:hypothetical protein
MAAITKARLAAELNVSKARVSQYVKRGLPVLGDGKVDLETAVKWVADNHVALNSRDAGANRAAKLVQRRRSAAAKSAARLTSTKGEEARTALLDVLAKIEAVTAYAAIQAGAAPSLAFLIADIARLEAMDIAARHLEAIGADEVDDLHGALGKVPPSPFAPNWPAIAAEGGERFDPEAWSTTRAALPYWSENERPGSPYAWEGTPC